VMAALVVSSVLAAPGRMGAAAAGRPGAKGTGSKAELYAVVQIGDEIKVISKSEVNAEKDRLRKQFTQDKKTYEDAKKEAAKNKEKFDEPKPESRNYTLRVLKSSCKTEQEANDYRDKRLQEEESKPSKKTAAR
jgi:hypothetical protein